MVLKKPKGGWSKRHQMYNDNGFYFAHPELHTAEVDIVYPDEMYRVAQWQSEKSMFSAMPEFRWIADIFSQFEKPPENVLDIACGVGRASVYIAKQMGWQDSRFLMYDGTGDNPTYGGMDVANAGTIYNDLSLTEKYLELNGLHNRFVMDAKRMHLRDWLANANGSVQLAYSFMAFGFHFGIHEVLPALTSAIQPGGLVIFGTRGFDVGNGWTGTIVGRLNEQLQELDQSVWKVIRDARGPERLKCSVLVLQRREPNASRVRQKLPPAVEE